MFAVCGGGACAEHLPIEGARCSADRPCPKGYSCTGGGCVKLLGTPPARCERDEDCVIGVCLEDAGFCVQCASDADCAIGSCLTDSGLYQCGCEGPEQCATGRCNAATHACVPCFHDRQCRKTEWCEIDTGTCRDKKIDGDRGDHEGNRGASSAERDPREDGGEGGA